MSKKSDTFYFENFIACADYALQAAMILENSLRSFRVETQNDDIEKMHLVEHQADDKKHQLTEALIKAFITPIEQEDLLALSQNIDDITDTIEDVLLRIYMCNIRHIREDALAFSNLIITMCRLLKEMLTEFSDFKKSHKIKAYVIRMNELEEQGDKLFVECNHRLYTSCKDPVLIIAWRDVFNYFELCADACEHTADVVEMVIMKNT